MNKNTEACLITQHLSSVVSRQAVIYRASEIKSIYSLKAQGFIIEASLYH